ncbi:hypothetical protein LDL48_34645 [Wangella sp. NEAU-J3]|nr:hypothetical protein [Jidongwangia harbinensis]MCA2217939.1 hypothetical protein [Jidongwangia harbinensis]
MAGPSLVPPAPPSRWRRGPLLTLAAGAVLAAVLAGLTVAAAAGPEDPDDPVAAPPPAIATSATTPAAPTGSAGAPAVLPPTTPLAASTPADRTRATFAGRVPGAGTLAISVRDGVAIAYVCDGARIESWLKGTAVAGKLSLTGKGGARISATFDARRARGTVTVAGRTSDFDIRVAKKPSGLYRAAAQVRNARVVGSWIVLPDGSQVGVLTADEVPRPAPPLNVAGGTTTVDGVAVTTSTIDVDTGAGF